MNLPYLSVFFLLCVPVLASNVSEASVKLYRHGQSPRVLSDDLMLDGSSLKPSGTLNKGTASVEVLRYLDRNRDVFGLQKVDGEVLELRHAGKDSRGFSLRLVQRFHRVRVDGAEVVAMLDSSGALKALNSSLVATPSLSVQPEISKSDALSAAVARLGYKDPELGEGAGDGLLIVDALRGKPTLVWQFSIREHADASNPAQVQVLAQGAKKGRVHRAISLGHSVAGSISIYDASVTLVTPSPLYKGVKVLENGKTTLLGHALVGEEARAANRNLELVREFYSQKLGRTSWDGNGAGIDASVNVQRITLVDLLGQKQNAAWMAPWKMFVFGAGGDELGSFTSALDVVGHEFTHAVVSTTSNLEYTGQSGALNEHFADVFGAMIEQTYQHPANPFLIGDTVLRGPLKAKADALRDMLHPDKGLRPQPGAMNEIPSEFGSSCVAGMGNDNCGVHILSGIPNRVSALIVNDLGWDASRSLFYRVMTARLRANSQFADYRDQMFDECAETHSGSACNAVKRAFDKVGL